MFVTFEGLDWSGKSTQAGLLADWLSEQGRTVLRRREPGGTQRGEDVVCDRYLDSSVAYQGAARGLGEERVRELNLMVTNGLLPDRTFLVLLDPDAARQRGAGRPDRIEREGEDFWRRADEGFRALAAEYPKRIVALDGSGSPGEIAEAVREHVRALL